MIVATQLLQNIASQESLSGESRLESRITHCPQLRREAQGMIVYPMTCVRAIPELSPFVL